MGGINITPVGLYPWLDACHILLLSQGKYTDAEPLYLRSIATMDQIPDPDQTILGETLNNLAGLLHAQVRGSSISLDIVYRDVLSRV